VSGGGSKNQIAAVQMSSVAVGQASENEVSLGHSAAVLLIFAAVPTDAMNFFLKKMFFFTLFFTIFLFPTIF
jgi:hypothetical protein